MKQLGIIGGMGPAATARLFARIVELTDAACDQEHIDVRILSNPRVPDRTAFLLNEPGAQDFVPVLQQEAAELEAAGCEVIALPCNTSHARFGQIGTKLSRATLVNMVTGAADAARRAGCANVGVLATSGTLACGVYQSALEACGLCAAVPGAHEQELVMQAIYGFVKAGRALPAAYLEDVFAAFVAQGCDGLVLGCTELAYPASTWQGLPVVDALDVLARSCITACGARVKGAA